MADRRKNPAAFLFTCSGFVIRRRHNPEAQQDEDRGAIVKHDLVLVLKPGFVAPTALERLASPYPQHGEQAEAAHQQEDMQRRPQAVIAKGWHQRHPTVPAVLIGWLARHIDHAGLGLGEALLFDAIRTVSAAPIRAHAIFADAIDDRAAGFYAAYGFAPLISPPGTLYLPLATARTLLE